jgi:hypothetical protein
MASSACVEQEERLEHQQRHAVASRAPAGDEKETEREEEGLVDLQDADQRHELAQVTRARASRRC